MFLLVLAFFLIILGLVGAFLPALPGPPVSWLGLLAAFFSASASLSFATVAVSFVVMAAVTAMDYLLPPAMTRKFGGSRAGGIGATVGLVAGLFLPLPVLGVILCPFFGAFIFEFLNSPDDTARAFKSAWGAFIGFLLGTGAKAAVAVSFFWILVLNLVKGWF